MVHGSQHTSWLEDIAFARELLCLNGAGAILDITSQRQEYVFFCFKSTLECPWNTLGPYRLTSGTIAANSARAANKLWYNQAPCPHHIYISTNISSSTLTNSVTFPHIFYGLPSACAGPTPVDRTVAPLPRAASHAHPPPSTKKSGSVDDGCTSARRRRAFHSDVMMMELALRDLMPASEPPCSSAL